jgi:hypothetical protein
MLVVMLAAGAGAGVSSLLTGGDSIASGLAHDLISAASLLDYQQAASTCPGLPWTVLAAIGTVESDNGTSTLPGVQSGANSAGAEDIWMWDRGLWDVRDGDSLVRASGVSAPCEARGGADGRHTLSIRCPLREDLSGLACGVSE